MKALTITLLMVVITAVGSLSLILAINEDAANLENDVKKIEVQAVGIDNEDDLIPGRDMILQQIQKYPKTTITKLADKSSDKRTIDIFKEDYKTQIMNIHKYQENYDNLAKKTRCITLIGALFLFILFSISIIIGVIEISP